MIQGDYVLIQRGDYCESKTEEASTVLCTCAIGIKKSRSYQIDVQFYV